MKKISVFLFIFLNAYFSFGQEKSEEIKAKKIYILSKVGLGNSPQYSNSVLSTFSFGIGFNEKYTLNLELNWHNHLATNLPNDYKRITGFLSFDSPYKEFDNLYMMGLNVQRSFTLGKFFSYNLSLGGSLYKQDTYLFEKNPNNGGGWFSSPPTHLKNVETQQGLGINVRNGIEWKTHKEFGFEFSVFTHISQINTFYGWQILLNLKPN